MFSFFVFRWQVFLDLTHRLSRHSGGFVHRFAFFLISSFTLHIIMVLLLSHLGSAMGFWILIRFLSFAFLSFRFSLFISYDLAVSRSFIRFLSNASGIINRFWGFSRRCVSGVRFVSFALTLHSLFSRMGITRFSFS